MNRFGVKTYFIVACLVVLMLAGAAGIAAGETADSEKGGLLQVYGEAELFADPDKATIVLGVETQDKTAQTAVQENAKIAEQVIEALKELGLEEDQITTGSYRVHGQRQPIDSPREKNEYEIVYRVFNELNIEMTRLDQVGSVIDHAVEAGANHVQSVNFEISDPEDLKLQALQQSIKTARTKAEAMAESAGVQLVGIKKITEDQARYSPYIATFDREMIPDQARAETPIMPGEVSVEARVTMEFYVQ